MRDANKKALIQVDAETGQVKQNIIDLNKTFDDLLQKQKQLAESGIQNSKVFLDTAAQLKAAQTAIEKYSQSIDNQSDALQDNTKAFELSNNTLKQNKNLMVSLLQQHERLFRTEGDHTEKVKALNTQISSLSNTLTGQITTLTKSRGAFDAHKATIDALSSGFARLKGASGIFGPVLQEAAKGFGVLKSGLAVVPQTQKNEDQVASIKKASSQQVEDYAKQSEGRIAAHAFNTLNAAIRQQSAAKIAALEKDKAAELSNANLTSAQKLAIEQKYKQQEARVKAKAFKEEQEASIAQAVINGALAVTKVSAQSGILAPLEIGVVIAETAAQVAKIAAQKPPAFAQGGLYYNSDGRGGVLAGYSKTDNTNAYLRSGEGIVVSEAMQVPWARNLVSAINVGFGGRDFSMPNPGRGYAVGGIFTDGGDANRYYNQPVTDQKNLANTIAYQMINNFPPVYVDVKDVNNAQSILAQTINRVNL
jgi:hypothetical protein